MIQSGDGDTRRYPPPHGYRFSPVHEVCCRWESTTTPPVTILIHGPYPGWERIRSDIRSRVRVGNDPVYRCQLRFHDRFPLSRGDGPESILMNPETCTEMRTGICRTHILPGNIRSESRVTIQENRDLNAVDLFFLVTTAGRIMSVTDIAGWFDDAHAIIHHLFDAVVHEEVKRGLTAGLTDHQTGKEKRIRSS